MSAINKPPDPPIAASHFGGQGTSSNNSESNLKNRNNNENHGIDWTMPRIGGGGNKYGGRKISLKDSFGPGKRPSRYLKKDIGQILVRCLMEVCEVRPKDPIEYIAHWLYKSVDAELYFYEKVVFNKECQLLVLEYHRTQARKQTLIQQINQKMKELKRGIRQSKLKQSNLIQDRLSRARLSPALFPPLTDSNFPPTTRDQSSPQSDSSSDEEKHVILQDQRHMPDISERREDESLSTTTTPDSTTMKSGKKRGKFLWANMRNSDILRAAAKIVRVAETGAKDRAKDLSATRLHLQMLNEALSEATESGYSERDIDRELEQEETKRRQQEEGTMEAKQAKQMEKLRIEYEVQGVYEDKFKEKNKKLHLLQSNLKEKLKAVPDSVKHMEKRLEEANADIENLTKKLKTLAKKKEKATDQKVKSQLSSLEREITGTIEHLQEEAANLNELIDNGHKECMSDVLETANTKMYDKDIIKREADKRVIEKRDQLEECQKGIREKENRIKELLEKEKAVNHAALEIIGGSGVEGSKTYMDKTTQAKSLAGRIQALEKKLEMYDDKIDSVVRKLGSPDLSDEKREFLEKSLMKYIGKKTRSKLEQAKLHCAIEELRLAIVLENESNMRKAGQVVSLTKEQIMKDLDLKQTLLGEIKELNDTSSYAFSNQYNGGILKDIEDTFGAHLKKLEQVQQAYSQIIDNRGEIETLKGIIPDEKMRERDITLELGDLEIERDHKAKELKEVEDYVDVIGMNTRELQRRIDDLKTSVEELKKQTEAHSKVVKTVETKTAHEFQPKEWETMKTALKSGNNPLIEKPLDSKRSLPSETPRGVSAVHAAESRLYIPRFSIDSSTISTVRLTSSDSWHSDEEESVESPSGRPEVKDKESRLSIRRKRQEEQKEAEKRRKEDHQRKKQTKKKFKVAKQILAANHDYLVSVMKKQSAELGITRPTTVQWAEVLERILGPESGLTYQDFEVVLDRVSNKTPSSRSLSAGKMLSIIGEGLDRVIEDDSSIDVKRPVKRPKGDKREGKVSDSLSSDKHSKRDKIGEADEKKQWRPLHYSSDESEDERKPSKTKPERNRKPSHTRVPTKKPGKMKEKQPKVKVSHGDKKPQGKKTDDSRRTSKDDTDRDSESSDASEDEQGDQTKPEEKRPKRRSSKTKQQRSSKTTQGDSSRDKYGTSKDEEDSGDDSGAGTPVQTEKLEVRSKQKSKKDKPKDTRRKSQDLKKRSTGGKKPRDGPRDREFISESSEESESEDASTVKTDGEVEGRIKQNVRRKKVRRKGERPSKEGGRPSSEPETTNKKIRDNGKKYRKVKRQDDEDSEDQTDSDIDQPSEDDVPPGGVPPAPTGVRRKSKQQKQYKKPRASKKHKSGDAKKHGVEKESDQTSDFTEDEKTVADEENTKTPDHKSSKLKDKKPRRSRERSSASESYTDDETTPTTVATGHKSTKHKEGKNKKSHRDGKKRRDSAKESDVDRMSDYTEDERAPTSTGETTPRGTKRERRGKTRRDGKKLRPSVKDSDVDQPSEFTDDETTPRPGETTDRRSKDKLERSEKKAKNDKKRRDRKQPRQDRGEIELESDIDQESDYSGNDKTKSPGRNKQKKGRGKKKPITPDDRDEDRDGRARSRSSSSAEAESGREEHEQGSRRQSRDKRKRGRKNKHRKKTRKSSKDYVRSPRPADGVEDQHGEDYGEESGEDTETRSGRKSRSSSGSSDEDSFSSTTSESGSDSEYSSGSSETEEDPTSWSKEEEEEIEEIERTLTPMSTESEHFEVECTWQLRYPVTLVCSHPILGTITARHPRPVKLAETPKYWTDQDFRHEVFYNSEVYTVDRSKPATTPTNTRDTTTTQGASYRGGTPGAESRNSSGGQKKKSISMEKRSDKRKKKS